MNPAACQAEATQVDWFRVIVELQRKRLFHRAIGKRVGVSKATVFGWQEGSEPRHRDGEALIALWVEVTGKPREDVPRRKRFGHW